MKFRVHYTAAKLRGSQTTDLNAENKGIATALFSHHFPGCKLTRIDPIGDVATPAKASRPAAPMGAQYRPMTDTDRENCIKGLQKLREKLRTKPAPTPQPGAVGLSIEQRDRGLRRPNP